MVIQKNDKSKNGHNKININTYVILWYKGSEQERERKKKQSGTHSIENILKSKLVTQDVICISYKL